jgi:hypothetical protein
MEELQDTRMQDLARRVLALSPKDQISSQELVAATDLACRRLHRYLSRLLGQEGSFTLLSRSLKSTAPRFPSLQSVRIDPRGASIEGLEEAVRGLSGDAATEMCVGIVEAVLNLLSSFVGPGLTTKLAEEAFVANDEAEEATE